MRNFTQPLEEWEIDKPILRKQTVPIEDVVATSQTCPDHVQKKYNYVELHLTRGRVRDWETHLETT
jgi:hypothetical protein